MVSSENNIGKKAFNAAVWVIIFQFARRFVQIAIGIYLVRCLEPSDYGVLGMLAIFWAVSDVFIQGGFGDALLQKKEVTQTDLSSVFYYNLFVSLVFCFLMIIFSGFIANYYNQPVLSKTIKVSAWMLPIGALSAVQKAILGRKLKQQFINLSQLLSLPISGCLAVFLAAKGFGLWALVWQQFSIAVLGTVFITSFVRWCPSCVFSLKSLKSLFAFGSKLLFVDLMNAVFANIHKAVIGKLFAADTLGYYEQAHKYSTLWPYTIQHAVSAVLFPAFAKLQDDPERLKNAFSRSLELSLAVVIFPACLSCFLIFPIVSLILTDKWLLCIPYWWLITGCIVLYPIHLLNLRLITAVGRSDLFLKLEILKKVLTLVSLGILVAAGMIPMLIWEIAASIFCLFINCYYSSKMINLSLGAQIRDLLRYLVLSLAASGCALLTYMSLRPLSPWFGLISGLVLGILLYILFNLEMKTVAFTELKRLLLKR